MAEWERDEARIDAAIEEALKIPGVHTVNSGFRWKHGQRTNEPALCVLVYKKKRLDDLAPADRVPKEIFGIPTDVIEADLPTFSQVHAELDPDPIHDVPDLDTKDYTQMRGGIQIYADGYGTLGCIARATNPDHAPKLVALSNQHVLMGPKDKAGGTVYQADRSCCCCGRKIGVVLRGLNTLNRHFYTTQPSIPSVDAAIALINPGVPCLGEMQVGIGDGTATELVKGAIAAADIKKGLEVKKRGQRTTQTNGIISGVKESQAPTGTSDKAYAHRQQIIIDPVFAPGTTEGYFYVSAPGDSGSVYVTSAGDQVVALHWASRNMYPDASNKKLIIRQGVASPIHRVMEAMEIDIPTTTTAGQVLTNPAEAESPQAEVGAQPAFARTMLGRAQADIEQTAHGLRYAELIRRHHKEVASLVNANARVGAVWKRNGGQQLVQMMLDAVARPSVPIPETIGERTIEQAASRIAAILRRFGSTALVRDLDVYERAFPRVCGCTYNQLLGRLRAGEPVLG